ncbi:helix-turn-helix transcriptional regulator [Roseospira marina]|uniref:Helix-turn-helix transcriptional regulator n=1 Tax=Roseospira marina TaxID=140057 RepID=A0A5M6I5K5_9PROT|nr:helix-turn-helix transcriptional regulator [Roseospira marina]KAA5603500.1 helix-turn-helix transcriptional regulator [Roseospira marina]MBB4315472.1 transcriptional regulator with XRE-family HTH domain [Roseospira marina]MBB5088382.1 transcriptional regulator with XRE-family HTH domain [Roseospira marina]
MPGLEAHPAGDPSKTRIAHFLDERLTNLQGVKTQRQIAKELGYDRANIVSMFKRGDAKIPLDRLPALARAIDVDLAHLLRLGLEQYWPADDRAWYELNSIMKRVVSENEMAIIEYIRTVSNEGNPALDDDVRQGLKEVFSSK